MRAVDPGKVRRVLLCSGKVYYDLLEQRLARDANDSCDCSRRTILSVSGCNRWSRTTARYRKAREWVWVQEESLNMGGWTFMEQRLRATGVRGKVHRPRRQRQPSHGLAAAFTCANRRELVEAAFAGPAPHLVRAVRMVAAASRERKPTESVLQR